MRPATEEPLPARRQPPKTAEAQSVAPALLLARVHRTDTSPDLGDMSADVRVVDELNLARPLQLSRTPVS